MENSEFNQIFESLPSRKRQVLLRMLASETDEQISEGLRIHPGTVRKQISSLCEDFRLSGSRRSPKRSTLIALVAKCKPELLKLKTTTIKPSSSIEGLKNLTPQQNKILSCILAGETDSKIAASLGIQVATVRKHVERIYKVLKIAGASTRSRRSDLLKLISKHSHAIASETSFQKIENHITKITMKTNPFTPLTGLITEPESFFGRQQELEQVFCLLNGWSNISIVGERGVGKSSLLLEIVRQSEFRLQQPRKPIYINPCNIFNDNEFYEALCDEIGIPVCQGFRLRQNLNGCKFLLILDEVKKLSWNCFTDNLRGDLSGFSEGADAPFRLVFASVSPLEQLFPNDSIFRHRSIEIGLERWTKDGAKQFIEQRLGLQTKVNFSESDIKELIDISACHPQKLMYLCWEKFRFYRDTLTSN